MGQTLASNKRCIGADCNDKNPTEYGCNVDARIIREKNQTVNRWQDFGQPKQVIIQQLYSEQCQSTWTRAYIPDDTYLFIREQELTNGGEQVNGLSQVRGQGYFWADSNMSNGAIKSQACVAISTGFWFWYDRHCIDFDLQ